MKDYRDVPISNEEVKPLIPIQANLFKACEVQDALNGVLNRILDGLCGSPHPCDEQNKPMGLIEHSMLVVEQSKMNFELASQIYDMLLGER